MKVAVVHNRDTAGVISVFGPQNREKYNPKTVERVAKALEAAGHSVRVIDGNMHVVEQLREFMPKVISGDDPGIVFNMAYGIQGISRYTHLPAMLEMLGVPYVGSNPLAHGLALDKVVAKIVFKNAELPTAKFWNFASPDESFDDLEFPVIVKPKMEAVSYGISVVDNEKDLREAVKAVLDEFQQHVLVEQFIPGREFAVGLLGNGDPEVLPIVEIDLGGDPCAIQSVTEKLQTPMDKICPALLPEEKADELRALAKRAFQSLGLFDFARVDVRMDSDGRFYLLEINSMASLGLTGSYVRAAEVAGYGYKHLINRMLDVAAARYFGPHYGPDREVASGKEKKSPPLHARIRTYVRSQAKTFEDLLHKMVDMRTPLDEPERVNAFGEWLTAQFKHIGFEVTSFPMNDVGNVLLFSNHEGAEFDVLLLGHLDSAVPVAGFVPYREEGNRIFGTGIAESKGGLVVAIAALRALRFARTIRKIRCGVLLTTDEVTNGSRGRAIVEDVSAKAKYVVGLKAADSDGGLVMSRSGRISFFVEVTSGKTKKAVTDEQVLSVLYKKVTALKDLENPEKGLKVGIRELDFDAPFERFPTRAHAAITVRFDRRQDASEIDEAFKSVLNGKVASGLKLFWTRRFRRPPMEKNEQGEGFYEHVKTIADRINVTVRAGHRWHSSDICFVKENVPTLDGFGPAGGAERTEREYVVRNSIVDHAVLLAMVIHWCAGKDN